MNRPAGQSEERRAMEAAWQRWAQSLDAVTARRINTMRTGFEAGFAAAAVSPVSVEGEDERVVYEVERDRHGLMYSGPLEVGECVRVAPLAASPSSPTGPTDEGFGLGTRVEWYVGCWVGSVVAIETDHYRVRWDSGKVESVRPEFLRLPRARGSDSDDG